MKALMLRSLLALTLLAALIGSTADASSCPGVDRNRLSDSTWTTDLIRDSAGSPLSVQLNLVDVAAGTSVEYFNGSQWIPMSTGIKYLGEALRFTTGGDGTFRLSHGDCDDEWSGNDEY